MWGHLCTELSNFSNFNVSFSTHKSEVLIHLSQWQYWWWFWFSFFWTFYFFVILRVMKHRVFKMNIRLNTSFRSRGKWGDYLVTLIPLSWCLNILLNSNFILRMIEWQSESGNLILRIHGKQWYWVYKYDLSNVTSFLETPKNIGTNKWRAQIKGGSQVFDNYLQAAQSKIKLISNKELWEETFVKEFNPTSTFSVSTKANDFGNLDRYTNTVNIATSKEWLNKQHTIFLDKTELNNNQTTEEDTKWVTNLFKKKNVKPTTIDIVYTKKDKYNNALIFYKNLIDDWKNILNTKQQPLKVIKINKYINPRINVMYPKWLNEPYGLWRKIKLLNSRTLENDINWMAYLNKKKKVKSTNLNQLFPIKGNYNNPLILPKATIEECERKIATLLDDTIGKSFNLDALSKPRETWWEELNAFWERIEPRKITRTEEQDEEWAKNIFKKKTTEPIDVNIIYTKNIKYNDAFKFSKKIIEEVEKVVRIKNYNTIKSLIKSKTNVLLQKWINHPYILWDKTKLDDAKVAAELTDKNKYNNAFLFSKKLVEDWETTLNMFQKDNKQMSFYENNVLDDEWEVYSSTKLSDVNHPCALTMGTLNGATTWDNKPIFFFKFFDSGELIIEKPDENVDFLVVKQKRYKRKQDIKLYTVAIDSISNGDDDNESVKTSRFLKNNLLFGQLPQISSSEPYPFYSSVRLNRNRAESFSINLSRRLLRTTRTLVLPAFTNISIIANSYDVVHSWFIPGLGLKIDCVPGKSTHHSLYIDNVGLYYGQCAEICGRYHHHMPIRICALPFEHFLVWWTSKGLPKSLRMRYDIKNIEQTIPLKYTW